jgi:putative ABC transport system substrate-binding protein
VATQVDRRSFAIGVLGLSWIAPASAQSKRALRLAWLSSEQASSPSPNLKAFRAGLRDLGYVEGRDIVIEPWWAEGSGERMERLAGEVVGSRPGVIVAAGGLALFALKRAGATTPIVFSISADPVEAKVAESFSRPGGTMTGISLFTLALVGKRMEVLKEALPAVRRIAVIANPQHPGEAKERDAARARRVVAAARDALFSGAQRSELEAALVEIGRARDDAVVAFADGFTLGFAGRLATFSLQTRIPVVDGWAPFAREGNLMTYGPVLEDVYRRLAEYVDKIAKGARPADLPIELPTRVELVVNLKTAKALGVTIPQSVLVRADEVIR